MRKEHKCKQSQSFISQNLGGCIDKEGPTNEYKDFLREKKRHSSHKCKEGKDYSDNKNEMEERSFRVSEKVIQIHGSSSEEEIDNSDPESRIFCRSKHFVIQKHSSYGSCKSNTKKDGNKRKHRSKTESPHHSDLVSKKPRHHSSKKQHKYKERTSDSDSEENYSNHHKKSKIRNSIPDDYKELRKVKKKMKEDNETRKIKSESEESVRVKDEPFNMQATKHLKVEEIARHERIDRSEPSGSRNNLRPERQESGVREFHEWGGSANKIKPTKSTTGIQKPNFGLSGKLAEDTNTYNGVVIKYSEPPEARMPKKRWRLYPFKGDQGLPTLYIHRQSAYLLGRDRKVVDIPIDHPSCSKQHAALQYRLISYQRPNGTLGKQIRLYIIDLESANGTFINNNKIEAKKYVELFEKDVIKFGFSSREYVLLHEHSKDDENSEDDS